MAADQELPEHQLPTGQTPIWIQSPSWRITQVQMLERVETMAGEYKDILVLYSQNDKKAGDWCRARRRKYRSVLNIYGCEAQCVVLLDGWLQPEFITRGVNMLIIVSR